MTMYALFVSSLLRAGGGGREVRVEVRWQVLDRAVRGGTPNLPPLHKMSVRSGVTPYVVDLHNTILRRVDENRI